MNDEQRDRQKRENQRAMRYFAKKKLSLEMHVLFYCCNVKNILTFNKIKTFGY